MKRIPPFVMFPLVVLPLAALTMNNFGSSNVFTLAFQLPKTTVRSPLLVFKTKPHYNFVSAPLSSTTKETEYEYSEGSETLSFDKKSQLRALLRNSISKQPLLSSLSEVELEVLVQLMKERKLRKDDLLLKIGEAATKIFVVSDGAFESFEYDKNGEEVKLFTNNEAGEWIGAMSYASKKPFYYSVRAASEVASVWYIETEKLDELLKVKRSKVQESMWAMYAGDKSKFAGYLEERAKYDAIASCGGLFDNLTENDKQAVAKKLVLFDSLSKDTVLCTEGARDIDPDLFIVVQGELQGYKEKHPKEVLKKFKDGAYCGEISVLFNRPRGASIRVASEAAKVYALSRKDLLQAVTESDLSEIATDQILQQYKSKRRVPMKDLYEIYRLKSLPKKKTVSPHSILSTTVVGTCLLTMMPHFAPKILNGFRIFRTVIKNPTPEHSLLLNACNIGMFLVMLSGFFRFPKKGQSERKVVFGAIGMAQVFHTFVGLSNLAGPGSGYLIDAWSWFGRALIVGSLIMMCFTTGLLYNISLFGPKMTHLPFYENHWRSIVSTTVFMLSNFLQVNNILPMLDSRGMFESITYPLYDACIGNGQCFVKFAKFMTNLYLSFGGFIATLQFEKKFSVPTCNVMLASWAILLLSDLYASAFTFVKIAEGGSKPHVELFSYLLRRMNGVDKVYFGSVALVVIYGAFQGIVKKRQMTGLFQWKQREPKDKNVPTI